MSEISSPNGTGGRGRRGKRFLSPSEKYEIWISLMRGEYTIAGAAERAGVDRSTIMKLRMVARQGALDALAASKPGAEAAGVYGRREHAGRERPASCSSWQGARDRISAVCGDGCGPGGTAAVRARPSNGRRTVGLRRRAGLRPHAQATVTTARRVRFVSPSSTAS